jgi:hypothetical protein
MMLSDEAFNAVPSLMNSDSAMAFAMFLNNLPDMDSELPSSTLLKAIEVRCRHQYPKLFQLLSYSCICYPLMVSHDAPTGHNCDNLPSDR